MDPWGQERQDLRAAAQVNAIFGSQRTIWRWPYYETPEMLEEAFLEIARQQGVSEDYVRRLIYGDRRNHTDSP